MEEVGKSIEISPPPKWTKIDSHEDVKPLMRFFRNVLKDPDFEQFDRRPSKFDRLVFEFQRTRASLGLLKELHISDYAPVWVLKDADGSIKGSLMLRLLLSKNPQLPPDVHVVALYLDPKTREKHPGAFHEIMSILDTYCAEEKIEMVWFNASQKNRSVVDFYKTIAVEYTPKSASPESDDDTLHFYIDMEHTHDAKHPLFEAIRRHRNATKNDKV